jgi:clan AA aspartic protease (TIGR02281 family)
LRRDVVILTALLALPGGSSFAGSMVYKCRDSQGRLVYQESPCKQSEESISSWAASSIAPVTQDDKPQNAPATVYVIKQSANGHYILDGQINGKELSFVIDTGASAVSLPRPVAFLARISCKEHIKLQTAGGSASGCTAVIPTLKFGPFQMQNVPAIIVPNLDQPLLGMNVLSQFKIVQNNGEMQISKRD